MTFRSRRPLARRLYPLGETMGRRKAPASPTLQNHPSLICRPPFRCGAQFMPDLVAPPSAGNVACSVSHHAVPTIGEPVSKGIGNVSPYKACSKFAASCSAVASTCTGTLLDGKLAGVFSDGDGDGVKGADARIDASVMSDSVPKRSTDRIGLRRLADQRSAQELLDDAVSLLAGVRASVSWGGVGGELTVARAERVLGLKPHRGDSEGENGSDALDSALGAQGSVNFNPGSDDPGCDSVADSIPVLGVNGSGGSSDLGGDSSGGGGSEDDDVRSAIRSEMAAAGMTQHIVALQAGVSQPVLCTYLGGKANGRSHGKNSPIAVRAKLLAWLSNRGAVMVPSVIERAVVSPTLASPLSTGLALSTGVPRPPPAIATSGTTWTKGPTAGAGVGPAVSAGPGLSGGGDGSGSTCGSTSRAARKLSEDSAVVYSSGGGGKSASCCGRAGAGGSKGFDGCARAGKGHVAGGGAGIQGKNIKLTPHHLHIAYIWYLRQRDAEGIGLKPGEEEAFCLKCKDGGDVLLCDYSGCTKSYHLRCCGLKSVPEGIWECPRHRCVECGSGPSQTDASVRPRHAHEDVASTLWPCRTCPTTYCERCLPEEIVFAGEEIVCERCYEVLQSDVALLQLDLIRWKPELFAR